MHWEEAHKYQGNSVVMYTILLFDAASSALGYDSIIVEIGSNKWLMDYNFWLFDVTFLFGKYVCDFWHFLITKLHL